MGNPLLGSRPKQLGEDTHAGSTSSGETDQISITLLNTGAQFDQSRTIRGWEGTTTVSFSTVNVPVENCIVIIAGWSATSTNATGGTFAIKESTTTLTSRSYPSVNSLYVQVADLYHIEVNPSVGDHTYSLEGTGLLNTTRVTNCGGKVIVIEPDLTGANSKYAHEEAVLP